MPDYVFSKHASEMMQERKIAEDWVWQTLKEPDETKTGDDGNLHFTKAISEKDNRILRVIVNPAISPKRIVTVFFDRRLRSKR